MADSDAPPVVVHPQVRAYIESLGEQGLVWLDALPARVNRICQVWSLRRGAPLPGGSRSYVCQVTTEDGEPAVLKVALSEPGLDTQLRTLLAADGVGYVGVLAHDLREGALLLEALGPTADEVEGDVTRVLDFTARTLRDAWRVPSDLLGPAPTEQEHKAAGLLDLLGTLSHHAPPSARKAVKRAETLALDRLAARDVARQVVVHGDPHTGNLLRVRAPRAGAASGYVLVDPEGFRCEPEYDLGVAVRGWNETLLASSDPRALLRAWCERLSVETGTDADAIWQWAFIERITTGLYLAHHGLARLGAPFLDVATRLVD
ncbi:aminoglycoside phosphotransferase family protein [Deinococcus pimensis]|uniref:aminoglycoside phosphotransferase family protein n=1 Tax=Deinococcus pimensis TaxID=309888 RepID=UPI000694B431|nr:aminoglycoside phosphotransferase family protein [Deinococcus pimensis]